MAFEGLSGKLQEVFKQLRSKGKLTEDDVKSAMREVKIALLEADVNFKIVKSFIKKVTERAVGSEVLEGLNPGQQVIKIVNEEMIEFFCKNNFKVYISIDGPKKINDYLRGEYFDKLMSIIQNIKKSNIKNKLELICTYTKYHQENLSMNELENFFNNIGVKYSISDVITDDKTLKIKKSKLDIINQEIEFIDKSLIRIKDNSLNVGISAYLRNAIDALILKSSSDYFCNELVNGYSRVYDYNGDLYSCIRLLGTHKADDSLICKYNVKQDEKCLKCWARNFCHDCTADLVLGNVKPTYLSRICYKKIIYKYAIQKLLELYHSDIKLFNKVVDNFYSNYLF